MRVTVIGAGIGGLVAAVGLQRAGADVTVFERAPGLRTSGSGLSLWGNAFTALDAVGLDLRPFGAPQWDLTAGQRRTDGRWLSVIPAAALRELRVLHRADLHRAMSGALKPGTIHYDVDIPPDHDRLAGRDVVVAADGLRSRTRASWPGDPGIRYSGYSTWRGVTERPVDLAGGAGETLGAGQAMEDAATLTRLLAPYATAEHPDPAAIDHALDTYDRVRRARTRPIAARARKVGAFIQNGGRVRDVALRLVPGAVVARQLRALQSWAPPPG